MADDRKYLYVIYNEWHTLHKSTSKRFAAHSNLEKNWDNAVADSPILQRYLQVKHNFLCVTDEYVFVFCDRCNEQYPKWVAIAAVENPRWLL